MKKQSQPIDNDEVQPTLSVYLAEYEQMRTEILQVQGAQGQLVLYAILSLGAAIPIISNLLEKQIWESLLVIPLVFSSMGWVYAGYLGMMFRIAIYVHNVLRPNINNLLHLQQSVSNFDVLTWELFARKNNMNLLATPRNFEIVFFALPSIGALLLYFLIKKDFASAVTEPFRWLIAFDIMLIIGAVISALLIAIIGFRRLSTSDKDYAIAKDK